ncbi:MAG: aminotransferase class III-fold pyridoxal phosphate-dependent enzyme [Thermoplasmatales archaeon]|nr:aminotransferase class III-fold pyridoxal phosphate-dependent enzyme [Thermoplasmatales archaeon]
MYPRIRTAKGAYLFDEEGKKYINFSESINILGHRNQELLSVIRSHLKTEIIHYPMTISTQPAASELENKLKKVTGLNDGTAIFSSSGSEACDIALSILSDFGPVVTLKGGYQGLSGQFLNKGEYDRLRYGHGFNLSFPKSRQVIDELEEFVNLGARSILLEELQVEAGVREVYDGFLKDVKDAFPELLVCVDESYTGLGKTGRLFAYQWQEIVPDIVVIGKAIGGGIPLGITFLHKGVLDRLETAKRFRNNSFGSTAGNLMGLSIANFLIDKVSNDHFLGEVREKGDLFKTMFGEKLSRSIRGRGLILGIKLDEGNISDTIMKIREQGVYVTRMDDVIRISPPLNIPQDILIKGGKKIMNIIENL